MSDFIDQINTNPSQLAHQVLMSGVSTDGEKAERRTRQRRPYYSIQWIAARNAGELPDQSAFFPVRCYNLSEGGFSFLLRTRPTFEQLVAALATPQNLIYVAAKVVHSTEVVVSRSGAVRLADYPAASVSNTDRIDRSGTRMVLVGCRFTEHLGTKKPNILW